MDLQPVPKNSLVGHVVDRIRGLIEQGQLQAGDRLPTETELVTKLGVSRGALREAVRRQDQLRYSEPPDWIIPVRHALGAALMQSGRFDEAERVYREDLVRLPDNGWSLFGLARSLELQGKEAEAEKVRARWQEAWRDADVQLSASCFCQPGV